MPQVNVNAILVKETQGTEDVAADWKVQDWILKGIMFSFCDWEDNKDAVNCPWRFYLQS